MTPQPKSLLLGIVYSLPVFSLPQFDEQVIVIAEQTESPFTVVANPKQPTQPVPAFDASGFLRTIPGFTVARKGGSGGDISLRGQSGSRIQISSGGQQIAGTCGGRMDPPTNYISPQNYDELIVIKGPQAVKYGPVGASGTVIFDNKRQQLKSATAEGRVSMTAGSFERFDTALDTLVGNALGYWQMNTLSSQSNDYTDGDGHKMQSAYARFNGQTAIGFTPSINHLLELRLSTSTGHADYADRGYKARKIAHDSAALSYRHFSDDAFYTQLDALIYANKNAHIMDSFDTSRQPSGSAPERLNQGGHLWVDVPVSDQWQLSLGFDYLTTSQSNRMAKSLAVLMNEKLQKVYTHTDIGSFLEATYQSDIYAWVSGARFDLTETDLQGSWRDTVHAPHQDDRLVSGFTRMEITYDRFDVSVGLGHAMRTPDYWEVMKAGKKLFLKSEKTTQIDIGWLYHGEVDTAISLFYGQTYDFILIDKQAKPLARNIHAEVYGGELSVRKEMTNHWQVQSSLAYTRGNNKTDSLPLAQVSPVEFRLACDYHQDVWQMGAYTRFVGAQKRVAIGQGNIVSQDIGPSKAFAVFSLNGSYLCGQHLALHGGIDNLFNQAYAEHISKTGSGNALLPIDARTLQVNEPGRTFWLVAELRF